MNEWKITVLGEGGGGNEFLEFANVIAGGRRLLERLPEHCTAERIVLGADAVEQMRLLVKRAETENVVILASGDPMYHGIGGTISRLAGNHHLRIIPGITAFQRLFAKLGRSWNNASLFSIHGENTPLPWRRILNAEVAVVYGDDKRNASRIAEALTELAPEFSSRSAAIGCDLGTEHESIICGTLQELAKHPSSSLSVLLLFAPERTPGLPLGLPDSSYLHQNQMITHPEIRAVVLSKLRLGTGIFWDLGAGSGSIGLEAAGLCPNLQVYSVEKDAIRASEIQKNVEMHGIQNLHICEGRISDSMEKLPKPDRIFMGGGTAELEQAFAFLNPGGILTTTGILVDTCTRLSTALPENRIELLNLNISRAEPLSNGQLIWKAGNPILIAVFQKKGA